MQFQIQHQQEYSRGELLLRSFFGWFYILIPHGFLLMLYGIWLSILSFVAWWVILFTGKTPSFYYDLVLGLTKWNLRVSSRLLNMADGYPAFGLEGMDDKTIFHIDKTDIGRIQLLIRTLLGALLLLPHIIILYFRFIGCVLLIIGAWFSVLFTGKFPAEWHLFVENTLRWAMRVSMYMQMLYPAYPPFNGRAEA